MVALDGVIQRYEWGSTTSIQQLVGVPPDGRPAAELWFGAHPDAPSPTTEGATLDAVIAGDPQRALGDAVLERFGPRLPFLLKVLAADTALSIQVHPDLEQAQAGFAAEDAAGVARAAPNRNYRDANHKPELICALSPFEAMCGFRPVEHIRQVLDGLALPELGFLTAALSGSDPLRDAFTAVLRHADPVALSRAVAARLEILGDAPRRDDVLRGARLAARDFPGDIGVVVALLLNYVRLDPGEAIYLGAGNVHSYLRGTGVEIMANSNNVLRCGLTSKHIDVPELVRITDFTPLVGPRMPAVDGTFDVAVRDFRLTRLEIDDVLTVDDPGPCIILCASGEAAVGDVPVPAGRAVFVPAADPPIRLAATRPALVFVAGTRA
ncbi:MAG: mannose-6-phosphate isomerase, class I [Jatrophihabitans sp.]